MRCVGSRHSFTDIADAAVLLDLFHMPERFEVAADQASVTVNGSMIYSRLAELLAPTGRAVANLASLPHISIAGATATGTHGSGDGNSNLATSVVAIQVVARVASFVASVEATKTLRPRLFRLVRWVSSLRSNWISYRVFWCANSSTTL
ncbi:MAG: FAD-binding protein [Acidimicrobiales bacterium]|nr:FAD-binding protein [Acidimicrobiales bacterium]